MPRFKQPPRLWLRPARKSRKGASSRSAVWIILDGGRQIATGCVKGEDTAAQAALVQYIQEQHRPSRKERDIESIAIADVLSIYDEDRGSAQVNQEKFYERLGRLNEFWGALKLSEVTGVTCREYLRRRG